MSSPLSTISNSPSSSVSSSDLVDKEVVFILPTKLSPESYTIYSLVENPPPPPPPPSPPSDANASTISPPNTKQHNDDPIQTLAPAPFALKVCTTSSIPDALRERFVVRSLPAHLSHGNVDVIVSTGSGAGLALPFWQHALEPLMHALAAADNSIQEDQTLQPRHRVLVTQNAHSVRRFAHDAWTSRTQHPQRHQTVIVLSGDGGIVDLLNGLTGTPPSRTVPPTVAILPLGTANALFHSLHKPLYSTAPAAAPSPLVAALRTLFLPDSTPAPLPVFRARFPPGAHTMHGDQPGREVSALTGAIVASYGLHASIVWESDTPEYRSFGVARFGMVAAELLRQSHAYRARVDLTTARGDRVHAQRRTDEHGYVLATLVSNLERDFTISPAGRPLDGKLRLVRFGAVGGDKTMEIMMAAYRNGAHVDMRWPGAGGVEGGKGGDEDGVGYDEVQEVQVTMREEDARWRKVCIDGTVVEVPPGGTVTIQRDDASPFRILVPKAVLGVS